MLQRREVLKSLGAGIGLFGVSLAAALYKGSLVQPLAYPLGKAGPDVDFAALRIEAGADHRNPTAEQIEGPFYAPNSPLRRNIRDESEREPAFILSGFVVDHRGVPLPGAVLDFWQTDADARYDHHGYRYRGHQYADAQGRYQLITVRPSPYGTDGAMRTPHIHLKAQGPATRQLTSQLYLPDEPKLNALDPAFNTALTMQLAPASGRERHARFDIVLAGI